MNIRSKLNKNIIFSVVLAGIFAIIGVVLFIQSGKLRIVKLNYDETASLNYKVYLNNNNYYNKEYLEEGMQYISSIIKDIEIKYDYDIKYSEKVNSTVVNDIKANFKIVDVTNNSKIIYEKTDDIKTDKQEKSNVDDIKVDQTIKIDYQKYNSLANEFKSKYGISADCLLLVTFTTSQKNTTELVKDINRSKTMTMEIPLSEQMINISKTSNTNEKSAYLTTTAKTFSNTLMFILSIILFALTGLLVIATIYFLNRKSKLVSEYDRFIAKLLKQYDAYITESSNIKTLNSDVVYVKNFKELLDVRNNIEKAIIFNKVSENESRFIIVDDKQEYCYVVRREEFQ